MGNPLDIKKKYKRKCLFPCEHTFHFRKGMLFIINIALEIIEIEKKVTS